MHNVQSVKRRDGNIWSPEANIKSCDIKNIGVYNSSQSSASNQGYNKNRLTTRRDIRKYEDFEQTNFTKSIKQESNITSPAQFSSEFLKERSIEAFDKYNFSPLRFRDILDLDINGMTISVHFVIFNL